MKNLKTFALALAIMISGNTFASKEKPAPLKNSIPAELKELLKDPYLTLQKNYDGKVIFSVNEEKEIVLHAVLTRDEFMREYINSKLTDKVLSGNQWEVGKIYRLPVKLQMHK